MDPALDAAMLRTPFVASWFPRARPGDVHDPDPARRASAWAHWALTSCVGMTGYSDRPYTALALPGKFYDPRGTGPTTRPHLEIPASVFDRPDPQFPDRLAQAGNALLFPWWVTAEVLAVKRATLAPRPGDVSALVDLLNSRRVALVDALAPLGRAAAARWSTLEAMQVEDPQVLSQTATAPFSAKDVADFLPAAAELGLTIDFDTKLSETAAGWASRRIGVWRLKGTSTEPFQLGVLTPRLTRSSLFVDPLFRPDGEAPAALLVRGLLLRRLLRTHLGQDIGQAVADAPAARGAGPGLRAIVARVGDKLPEAGAPSAVHFLQNYPDATNAWAALSAWAAAPVGADGAQRAVLTISEEQHHAAHRAALRALHRAEDPDRDDINVLLPLAWDHQSRVVRVTFARPQPTVDGT